MAEVITLFPDTFRPRRPARSRDAELAIAADISILQKVELWARAQRQAVERSALPLSRNLRATAIRASDAIDPPRPV